MVRLCDDLFVVSHQKEDTRVSDLKFNSLFNASSEEDAYDHLYRRLRAYKYRAGFLKTIGLDGMRLVFSVWREIGLPDEREEVKVIFSGPCGARKEMVLRPEHGWVPVPEGAEVLEEVPTLYLHPAGRLYSHGTHFASHEGTEVRVARDNAGCLWIETR